MSFSYSRISKYEKCPFLYKLSYIDKCLNSDDTPVFEKGRYIHSLIEHHPNDPQFEFKFPEVESKKLEYMSLVRDFIRQDKKVKFLLSDDVLVAKEETFYLNEELKIVNTKEESLINGVIDYVGCYNDIILLVDWKTGKTRKYASFDQLKLYSIWAFTKYPTINKVKIYLFFIEQDLYVDMEITRNEIGGVKREVLDKIYKILNDSNFNKKPNENCLNCEAYSLCQPFKQKMKGK